MKSSTFILILSFNYDVRCVGPVGQGCHASENCVCVRGWGGAGGTLL